MKKAIFTLVLVLTSLVSAQARNDFFHDASALPEVARNLINTCFKAKVSVVKVERVQGKIDEYEVVLSDGTEVDFDRHGNWECVETNVNRSVPTEIVPQAIRDYMTMKQKGHRIVGIERDKTGYVVELSNGAEIRFNPQGSFLCCGE